MRRALVVGLLLAVALGVQARNDVWKVKCAGEFL
jgi:hypothetical protein